MAASSSSGLDSSGTGSTIESNSLSITDQIVRKVLAVQVVIVGLEGSSQEQQFTKPSEPIITQ